MACTVAPAVVVLKSADLEHNTPFHEYHYSRRTNEHASSGVDWLDQGHQLLSPNSHCEGPVIPAGDLGVDETPKSRDVLLF